MQLKYQRILDDLATKHDNGIFGLNFQFIRTISEDLNIFKRNLKYEHNNPRNCLFPIINVL